jgi:hypothetical protein
MQSQSGDKSPHLQNQNGCELEISARTRRFAIVQFRYFAGDEAFAGDALALAAADGLAAAAGLLPGLAAVDEAGRKPRLLGLFRMLAA